MSVTNESAGIETEGQGGDTNYTVKTKGMHARGKSRLSVANRKRWIVLSLLDRNSVSERATGKKQTNRVEGKGGGVHWSRSKGNRDMTARDFGAKRMPGGFWEVAGRAMSVQKKRVGEAWFLSRKNWGFRCTDWSHTTCNSASGESATARAGSNRRDTSKMRKGKAYSRLGRGPYKLTPRAGKTRRPWFF